MTNKTRGVSPDINTDSASQPELSRGNDTFRVGIVGGGAAGLMAAGYAIEQGAQVTVFEHRDRLALKLGITGKGRCNVTNDCGRDEFLANVPTNPRFLYTALAEFSPADTMEFFGSLGVELKVERGNRVFPVSDKASDIVRALKKYAADAKIVWGEVTRLMLSDGVCEGVVCRTAEGERNYPFDRVIVATGGMSYPSTGSRGAGYELARQAGLAVNPPRASLVPLTVKEKWCSELMGLSLRNVGVKIIDTNKGNTVFSDFGELLFTHFGISGPVVLSASAFVNTDKLSGGRYAFEIDLKPALDDETLDKRILRDFSDNLNRDFQNSLGALLPLSMIPVIVRESGIDPRKKVNAVTREERARLCGIIKHFTLTLTGCRPIDEAIVTSGGVDVRELSPKTMEAKRVAGLRFAGEVIDVDACTGGFNLQIAFSTARLAAKL